MDNKLSSGGKQNLFEYSLKKADWNFHKLKLTDPQEIFSAAHDYFSSCYDKQLPPTITGLGLILGMTKKELITIRNTEGSPQAKAINFAVSMIVDMVERELIRSKAGQPGLIFWLKNIDDWVDKTEIQTTKKTMSQFLEELKRQKGTTIEALTENGEPVQAQVFPNE